MCILPVLFIVWIVVFIIWIAWVISDQNKQRADIEKGRKEQKEERDNIMKENKTPLIPKIKEMEKLSPEKKPMSKYTAPYLEEYKWYFIARNVITKSHICDDWMVWNDFLYRYDILIKKPSKKLLLTKSIYSEVYDISSRRWNILYISKKSEYSSKNLADCKARIDIKDKSE